MKLSLSWIFDHIEKPNETVPVTDIVAFLNESTAEIEKCSLITSPLSALAFAQITVIDSQGIEVYIPEHATSARLAYRPDLQDGYYALVRMEESGPVWAHMYDFGSTKDALLPLVYTQDATNLRNWRDSIEREDYVLEIDNKSITHRPDLWSHRGFAREIAAGFRHKGWYLKPLESMIALVEVQEFSGSASPVSANLPTLTIHDKVGCRRLAGAFVSTVAWSPSRLPMMSRLCRIDSKPIDALVDITNYVMFDIGQPMHAFDAAQIRDHQLSVRKARVGETLRGLDGELLTLTPQDLILVDSAQPVSLAGIMGGTASAVKPETIMLLLEAGSFDPAMIRHSAARHKKRTEASLRFEKNLDPNQVIDALRRYLYLLDELGVAHTHDATVVVVGPKLDPVTIEVCHSFLEERLGTLLEHSFVINTLMALEFQVSVRETAEHVCYDVTAPGNRATKEIQTKEDILEEIGRFFGYKNIVLQPPLRAAMPVDNAWVYENRAIKRALQLSLHMHEIYSYAFFDETWLLALNWAPAQAVEALYPISGHWKRLVTTLIPNLLKAVSDNADHHSTLRFFESARIWEKNANVAESLVLSGIMYDAVDAKDNDAHAAFYAYKAELERFFTIIGLSVQWRRVDTPAYPWFSPYRTAQIVCDGTVIGTFGMIDDAWCAKVVPHGRTAHMSAFELDGNFLRKYKKPTEHYISLPKYPDISRDLSLWLPLHITAAQISAAIAAADKRIVEITLTDVFNLSDQQGKKSLTFRFVIRDEHKTLTKQEAETIFNEVVEKTRSLGGEVR